MKVWRQERERSIKRKVDERDADGSRLSSRKKRRQDNGATVKEAKKW